MSKLLRDFIREEFVQKSWLRRPKGQGLADISDELQTQRQDNIKDAKKDVQGDVQGLRRVLSTSMSFKQMKDAIERFGETPSSVASDPTMLARAVKEGDIDEIRRQLTTGLEKWETEMLKWSEPSENNPNSMVSHPTRVVVAGGTTGKRSMGV